MTSVSASHCALCLCVFSFTFLTRGSARRHILISDEPEWIQNVQMLISCIQRRSCPTLCQQHPRPKLTPGWRRSRLNSVSVSEDDGHKSDISVILQETCQISKTLRNEEAEDAVTAP